MLYDYCREHGVPHKRLGKMIVATSEGQIPVLDRLKASAAANGVADLEKLSAQEAASLEPNVHCIAALLSPSTGIIDSHSYMEQLLVDAEAKGAMLAANSQVTGADVSGPVKTVHARDVHSGEAVELPTRTVVNAAGLGARSVALSMRGLPASSVPPLHLAKGNYFSLALGGAAGAGAGDRTRTGSGPARTVHAGSDGDSNTAGEGGSGGGSASSTGSGGGGAGSGIAGGGGAHGGASGVGGASALRVSRLVYPVPEPGGLGVHLTLDLGGGVRFGPDVEWINTLDYTVDPRLAERFYPAIRAYLPALPDGALQAAYSGVRPKVSGPGEPVADFIIAGERHHGVKGLVGLFGIESPGLTSSMAIGEHVARMLTGR